MTSEELRELSNKLLLLAHELTSSAVTAEQWHAVTLVRDASNKLFSAAGALDIHDRKQGKEPA